MENQSDVGDGLQPDPQSGRDRFSAVNQALHWSTALIMAVVLVLGWIMSDQGPTRARVPLREWHKTLGLGCAGGDNGARHLAFFRSPARQAPAAIALAAPSFPGDLYSLFRGLDHHARERLYSVDRRRISAEAVRCLPYACSVRQKRRLVGVWRRASLYRSIFHIWPAPSPLRSRPLSCVLEARWNSGPHAAGAIGRVTGPHRCRGRFLGRHPAISPMVKRRSATAVHRRRGDADAGSTSTLRMEDRLSRPPIREARLSGNGRTACISQRAVASDRMNWLAGTRYGTRSMACVTGSE